MAQNSSSPSLVNFLFSLFQDEQVQAQYELDPEGTLEQHGLADASPQDITEAVSLIAEQNTINNQTAIDNNVVSNIDVDQGSLGQTALSSLGGPSVPAPAPSSGGGGGGGFSGGGGGGGGSASPAAFTSAPPPPPPPPPGTPPAQAAVSTINYYVQNITNVEDNDTSIVNDNDTTIDSSINQTILANGDVNQTFDNDTITASGEGAVAAGDDATGIATGDGAVAAGDDIEDTAINTGEFEGTQVGGDNEGDIQTVTGNVSGTVIGEVDDSNVNFGDEAIVGADDIGAASFGNGNATDFGEDNTIENVSTGSGDVTDVDASGGEGGGAGGNVNLGGTQAVDQSDNLDASTNDSFNQDNDLSNTTDESFNVDASTNDSANTSAETTATTTTEDSFNADNSTDNTDSFNADTQANTDVSADTTVDIDAQLEQNTQTTEVTESFNESTVEDVDVDLDGDGLPG